jgi:hypothetical protein
MTTQIHGYLLESNVPGTEVKTTVDIFIRKYMNARTGGNVRGEYDALVERSGKHSR